MKTINVSKLSNIRMAAGNEKSITQVIHQGKVKDWVGIGWVELREATAEDRETIPVAVYDDGTEA